MKRVLFMIAVAICLQNSYAESCTRGKPVHVRGDVPGAISYNIYRQLHPLTAEKLATMAGAQQVKLLPDNALACELSDDGVDDPSAVLLGIPGGSMNYWVPARQVRRGG